MLESIKGYAEHEIFKVVTDGDTYALLFDGRWATLGSCERCGAKFWSRRAGKRFCGLPCQNNANQRAYRERKAVETK